MYNIIPLIIILFALAVILYIVFKKLPLLANFDIKTIPKEKESETKEKIINERIQRKARFFYTKIDPFIKKVTSFGQVKIKTVQNKLKDLEEKYKHKLDKGTLITKEEYDDLNADIEKKLDEGHELMEKEEYEKSEKIYIEIISLDSKNIEAYRGLGSLYFLQKNYDEARQVFEHILKINPNDSSAFSELAEIYLKIEEYRKAKENTEKALKIQPNNPKFLDLLIKINIIRKDKIKAESVLQKLKVVNPENKKIKDFEEEIKQL